MDAQEQTFHIARWLDLPSIETAYDEIVEIFFEASATKSFATPAIREAFLERWLGRYLMLYPEHAFIALGADGKALGYIVGSLDDPAHEPLFQDLAYLTGFAHLTARYPAQLHVNVHEAARGRGIGAALVDTFVRHAEAAGAPGVHLVTSRGMRNVGFYEANGFAEVGAQVVNGKELLFLARGFGPQA